MGCEKGRDVIPRDFGRAFVLMQNSNGCLCSKKRHDDGGNESTSETLNKYGNLKLLGKIRMKSNYQCFCGLQVDLAKLETALRERGTTRRTSDHKRETGCRGQAPGGLREGAHLPGRRHPRWDPRDLRRAHVRPPVGGPHRREKKVISDAFPGRLGTSTTEPSRNHMLARGPDECSE